MTDTAPRIYVACLASYNNGKLYGRWIDASTDVDAMSAEINDMLRGSSEPNVMRAEYENETGERHISSGTNGEFKPVYESANGDTWTMIGKPFPSAEEWAIHDHEGLGGDLGEYAGLDEVAKRVALIDVADDMGLPVAVVMEAAHDFANKGDDPDAIAEALRDRYRGKFDYRGEDATWGDMVEDLEEETGSLDEVPERFRNYIDWEAMGRDARLNSDLAAYECDGEMFFFWNH